MDDTEAAKIAVVADTDQELAQAIELYNGLRQANMDLQVQVGILDNALKVTRGYAYKYLAQLVYHNIVLMRRLPAHLLHEVEPYLENFKLGEPEYIDPEGLAEAIRITVPRTLFKHGS